MPDPRVAPGTGTTQCKKNFAKVTVTVKSSKDQAVIKKAAVTVAKKDAKKSSKDGGACTLLTNDQGKAIFVVRVGTYKALAKAEGNTLGQAPDAPFKEKQKEEFSVKSKEDQGWDLVLDPVPRCKLFLRLQVKDPDGTDRPLIVPNAKLVYADGEEDVTFDQDGNLLGDDRQPGRWILEEKGKFKLVFKKPSKATYVLYEPRGGTAAKPTLFDGDAATKTATNRLFQLPHADWGLKAAKWTIANDSSTYTADSEEWDLSGKDALGTTDAPVTATLDARWQFARFTYYDRIIGGSDQVSSLPLLIAGYAAKPAHAPSVDDRTTHACWTIGDDEKTATQCIPWILYDSNAEKPTKDSQLRFTTKAHTFIKTNDDQSRELAVGEQKTPGAARLAYYDLPAEWRSLNWFVRTKPKGSDITDGKFWWELDSTAKVLGTKDKPLILSLDDMVLVDKAKKPIAPFDKKEAVCVFHHSFKTGTDLSDHGLFLAETDVAPRHGQPVDQTRYPVSKKEVLGRKSNDDPHTQLKENYVVRYPDWTRVVTAVGNVFEAFSERSVAKDGEDRVVGARAAINWFDATAQINGKNPEPGEVIDRPQAVRKDFCTVQAYVEMSNPVTRKRRDSGSSATKGSATTATGLGPLLTSRVDRSPDRAKEHESNQTEGWGIGRWDLCLLRCCGREGDSNEFESIVLFEYFRLGVEFITTGPTPTTLTNDTKKKTWVKTCVNNLLTRWNGPDGSSNAGRPTIEAQADTKFKIKLLRFFQMNPRKHADFAFRVIAHKQGSRDWMNSSQGLSQTSEGNEKPQTSGWFTAAHEMGHGGGLLDDYIEKWNFASYYQPGIAMLVPGDPYSLDNVDGKESMISGNHQLRPRHWWHIADWLHTLLPGNPKLQILHGTGTPKPFKLPHHPRNSATTVKFRTYLQFPYDSILDAGLTLTVPKDDTTEEKLFKSRCDLYLWPLGEDAYSTKVLPGKSGPAATKVDGILSVCVHIGLHYLGTTDHDWIRSTTANLVTLLQKTFSHRCVGKLKVGSHPFERCAIHISPRVIVGTHAKNDGYDGEIGAVAATWVDGDSYGKGTFVDPGNGYWYEIIYNDDPGANRSWRAKTPVWPTTAGNTVNCPQWGKVKFKCWTVANAKDKAYSNVIETLVKENQLHVVVEVGAGASQLTTAAGELPRIKIKSGDVVDLIKAVGSFAETFKGVFDKIATKRTELHDAYEEQKRKHTEADNKRQQHEQKRDQHKQTRDDKKQARDLLGARSESNATQYDQLTQEMNEAEQKRQEEETKRASEAQKADEAKQKRDDFKQKRDACDEFTKNEKWSTRIVAAIEQVGTTVSSLFTDTGDPMEDPFYRELVSMRNAASTAAGQAKATVASVKKALPEKWPRKPTSERYSVTPGVKAALGQLPDLASTTPADVSNVVSSLVGVAEKLFAFGNGGKDAADKLSKVEQGKTVITGCKDSADDKRAEYVRTSVKPPPSIQTQEWVEQHPVVLKAVAGNACAWGAAAKAATIEEQLQEHFAALLGLEVDKASKKGYERLLKPFADADVEIKFAVPPPPPSSPPPSSSSGPPPLPESNSNAPQNNG